MQKLRPLGHEEMKIEEDKGEIRTCDCVRRLRSDWAFDDLFVSICPAQYMTRIHNYQ